MIQLELSSERYHALMSMLERDVLFLKKLKVIDYSLLLGVHFISWGENSWYPPGSEWHQGDSPGPVSKMPRRHNSLALSRQLVHSLEAMNAEGEEGERIRNAADVIASANSIRDAARSSAASASSFMEFSPNLPSRQPSIQPSISAKTVEDDIEEISGVLNQKSSLGSQSIKSDTNFGWGTPAMAVRYEEDGSVSRQPVLLYFGIIDFLQKYNARKRLEKFVKTSLHGNSVSVADPKHYAARFLNFMKTIFIQDDLSDENLEINSKSIME